MFVMVDERLVWWKVTFPGVEETGEIVEHEIELRFRQLGEDEFPVFAAKFTAAEGAPSAHDADGAVDAAALTARWERVADLMMDVVRDWRGVAAANGEALPFNRDNFLRLAKVPNVLEAIGKAYSACRRAAPEIRTGN